MKSNIAQFKWKWRKEVEYRKKVGSFPADLMHQVDKEIAYLQALKKDNTLTLQRYLKECDENDKNI